MRSLFITLCISFILVRSSAQESPVDDSSLRPAGFLEEQDQVPLAQDVKIRNEADMIAYNQTTDGEDAQSAPTIRFSYDTNDNTWVIFAVVFILAAIILKAIFCPKACSGHSSYSTSTHTYDYQNTDNNSHHHHHHHHHHDGGYDSGHHHHHHDTGNDYGSSDTGHHH